MKKLLLTLSVVLTTVLTVNAQCTADPQYTEFGVYPDSATGMTAACIDVPYAETITVVVPADTTVLIGPFPLTLPIDSVVITNWDFGGITGFTYQCSAPGNVTSPVDGCAFEGGNSGCILVEGNPTVADIGSYQQIITVVAHVPGSPGNPSTIIVDYYYLQVLDCTSGVQTITNSKFLVYPNPARSSITLNGLNGIDVESVSVLSMTGQNMVEYTSIDSPSLDLDINHLESGIYFVRVNYNGVSETIKFIKE